MAGHTMSIVILLISLGAFPRSGNPNRAETWSAREGKDSDRATKASLALTQSKSKLDTDSAEAFEKKGSEYLHNRDYDSAIQQFNQALKLKPSLAGAFYGRGTAYWHKGEYDRAIEDYDQALRLNPGYANAFYGRGLAYAKKNHYDHAIQDYSQALKLNPSLAQLF
jgi:tetratricopeptide (TPR) repeat protein